MKEIIDAARAARERLAAALALLQSPDAGDIVDQVASPVARAMGALHGIESSGGKTLTEGGPLALDAVRQALGALQSVPLTNVTLDLAASQIAGSLGIVHSLAQQAAAARPAPVQAAEPVRAPAQKSAPAVNTNLAKTTPSVAPPAQPSVAPALPSTPPQPSLARTTPSVTPSMSAQRPAAAQPAAAQPAPAQPAAAQPAPAQPAATGSSFEPAPRERRTTGAFDKTAMVSRSPVAHLETQASRPQSLDAPIPAIETGPAPRGIDSKHAPSPPGGPIQGAQVIEANLGAHSATNFYKGLSGNDVVTDGGLFVATYQIPPIGAQVWLKVTMPGGYDFEAGAEVRWSRDTGVGDAPPGFGAALSLLSPEAKQLIHRYVRNREPLFHDEP